jgi:NAD-dependent SIR2 family protein deacetylase
MAKTVFILGAGASADAGVPVMNKFLEESQNLYENPKFRESLKDFGLVYNFISSLQTIHSKAEMDLDNIESVFAAIEFGKLLELEVGKLVGWDVIETAMKHLIIETIERKSKFVQSDNEIKAQGSHHNFGINIIGELETRSKDQPIAIITFNYDVLIDSVIEEMGYHCSYQINKGDSYSPSIPIIKLHGSLNWGICGKCGRVNFWPIKTYCYENIPKIPYTLKTREAFIKCGSSISKLECLLCHTNCKEWPLIVPPTWNKTQYFEIIQNVWRAAGQHLSEAENIFVVGYSLPESDYFFRYLYALGTLGKTMLKRIWVFDPDSEVDRRFKKLLGSQAEKKYKYFDCNYANAITEIKETLYGKNSGPYVSFG